MFTESLAGFFDTTSGFAVAASWTPSGGGAAQPADVILDSPTDDILGGRQTSNEYQITLIATVWPGIKSGESVTVSAITYKVRDVRLLDDGALKSLLLTKV